MRLVYLCAVDQPPPPNSDFQVVQEFFKSIPDYLHPRTSTTDSPHMLFFADRIGSSFLPEFHDFAIVFLSEYILSDPTALLCLGRSKTAFPNMVGIDLYNNLSPELKAKAAAYTKRIFSPDEGKEFLLTTFPSIAAAFDLETERLTESIETDGYQYLDSTIAELKKQAGTNKCIAFACYFASFVILAAMLLFTYRRFCTFTYSSAIVDVHYTIILCIEAVVLSALVVALSRFLFLLGKSFMVESIRFFDRAHAIGLGRLYLKLYKGKFRWDELRDVLASWNIDSGSAFRHLDAKDIEPLSLDKVFSSIKE